MEGQKFSQDKLPWYQVIFKQFPLALEEVIRCSNAGHKKYLDFGDKDWQNFSRVPDAKNVYLNAAMRHLKDSETHTFNEDMKEYDPKIRHLASFCWNTLAALEMEMRETNKRYEKAKVPDNLGTYPLTPDECFKIDGKERIISKVEAEAIQSSIEQSKSKSENKEVDHEKLMKDYGFLEEDKKPKGGTLERGVYDIWEEICKIKQEYNKSVIDTVTKSSDSTLIEQSEACKKAVRDACNSNKYELKETYAYTNPIQKKKLEKFRELAEEYESNPNTVGDLAKFISYYSRPTLSIDELLGSDDYPDFHNQEG